MAGGVILDVHELSDESDHAWEFTLAEKNLVYKQLLIRLLFVSIIESRL
jgi:hypothetical protein